MAAAQGVAPIRCSVAKEFGWANREEWSLYLDERLRQHEDAMLTVKVLQAEKLRNQLGLSPSTKAAYARWRHEDVPKGMEMITTIDPGKKRTPWRRCDECCPICKHLCRLGGRHPAQLHECSAHVWGQKATTRKAEFKSPEIENTI